MDHAHMTSREKVLAMLAKLDTLDAAQLPAEATSIVLALTMLRPKIVGLLPEDPAELDALLLTGAAWALALRGDDAEPVDLAELAAIGRPADKPAPTLSSADVASEPAT